MVLTGTNNLRKRKKSQLQFCCTHNVNLFISVLLSRLLSTNDDGDNSDNDDDDDDDDDMVKVMTTMMN
ncbi:hypothetical protein LOAG_03131 [Loa loa]|uniref:Wsv293 n=1 Tax=Loa loa TaxID=7209 RepID=A0A1I7VQI9_LOALO|nr:hypothetical protein LOAG_03131 [Loa loa]EFO25350.2 hypothetical protein LOAG_03131 [Loa loa]